MPPIKDLSWILQQLSLECCQGNRFYWQLRSFWQRWLSSQGAQGSEMYSVETWRVDTLCSDKHHHHGRQLNLSIAIWIIFLRKPKVILSAYMQNSEDTNPTAWFARLGSWCLYSRKTLFLSQGDRKWGAYPGNKVFSRCSWNAPSKKIQLLSSKLSSVRIKVLVLAHSSEPISMQEFKSAWKSEGIGGYDALIREGVRFWDLRSSRSDLKIIPGDNPVISRSTSWKQRITTSIVQKFLMQIN